MCARSHRRFTDVFHRVALTLDRVPSVGWCNRFEYGLLLLLLLYTMHYEQGRWRLRTATAIRCILLLFRVSVYHRGTLVNTDALYSQTITQTTACTAHTSMFAGG